MTIEEIIKVPFEELTDEMKTELELVSCRKCHYDKLGIDCTTKVKYTCAYGIWKGLREEA